MLAQRLDSGHPAPTLMARRGSGAVPPAQGAFPHRRMARGLIELDKADVDADCGSASPGFVGLNIQVGGHGRRRTPSGSSHEEFPASAQEPRESSWGCCCARADDGSKRHRTPHQSLVQPAATHRHSAPSRRSAREGRAREGGAKTLKTPRAGASTAAARTGGAEQDARRRRPAGEPTTGQRGEERPRTRALGDAMHGQRASDRQPCPTIRSTYCT
jgi:hypothetical protein